VLGRRTVTIVCKICSNLYVTAGGKRSIEHCSPRCLDVARLRRNWVPPTRTCAVCAADFVAFNSLQIYCSSRCRYLSEPAQAERRRKGQLRNIRKKTGGGSYIDPIGVADRCNWSCGICQMPIDRLLKYPDPDSLSLDHVMPLARGGEHAIDNVQAAHLRCNVRKGVKLGSKVVT
jgi:5-methylcytosine-specific restriction endonuclease McrA